MQFLSERFDRRVSASVGCRLSAGAVAARRPAFIGLVAGGGHHTVTVLRMRIWDSAIPALWFLAAPFLAAAALTVSFTATGHLIAGLYAATAVVGLTAVLLLAAAVKPPALSDPVRRGLDLLENTLLITIPPAMLWLIGLISLIRNRGIL